MAEWWDKVLPYITLYGMNVLFALLIFFIGKKIARFLASLIGKMLEKAKVDAILARFLENLSYAIMLVFVIIAAINKLGIETTSLVAILGAAGLAVGLALQGSLANFAAGVILIVFKPFNIGDVVHIAGVTGIVRNVDIFNTTLYTLDNKKVIIPNSKITGENIENLSAVDKRRVDLVFGISYSDNIKTAKEALLKVLQEDERVLKDPAPLVAVSELADSSVNLVCRPWVKPEDYWGVYFDTLEKGKLALEAAGITIPFPQMDVHLHKEDA